MAMTFVGVAPDSFAKKRKFRFRMVTVIPKTLPIWGDQLADFSEKVERMTGGGLRIRIYGAGELVPALGTFDAVKAGQVQMGHSAAYYWQGKIPAAAFFCSVPFGMDAASLRSWIKYGGGQELWDELYKPHGMKAFLAGNTGTQMGGWFRKPIQAVADFKGLKMRIPGLGGRVVERLGAKPILMPGGEIFTNLTTGVIDATEWVGPYHDYTMGFHKVAKYYYYPGWHEPGPALELMINLKAWEQLPPDYQQIVATAAAEMDLEMSSRWLAEDARYLQKIKDEGKVELRAFSPQILERLRQVSDEVKDEVGKTSPLATRIYQSYREFQKLRAAHRRVTSEPYHAASDR